MAGWTYDGRDPGLSLFSACLAAGAPMTFTPGMRILEVACCEADWLHLAAEAWPACTFVGVDHRAPNEIEQDGRIQRIQADALNPYLFPPQSFDAIVSLSAVEHFGLGHYGDPLDPNGDVRLMGNCDRWLKPGGWMYFDVPYDPTGYRVIGTECRVYDDGAISSRLSMSVSRGDVWAGSPVTISQWLMPFPTSSWYATARAAGTLIEKPSTPDQRYYYAATVWTKYRLTPQDSGHQL